MLIWSSDGKEGRSDGKEGCKDRDAKPLKGFGGGSVLEIIQSDGNGTCRTVYTVQMEEAVVVLHAFQKKSKTGIKTPKQDIDLVEQRLKSAHQKYKEWLTTLKKEVN